MRNMYLKFCVCLCIISFFKVCSTTASNGQIISTIVGNGTAAYGGDGAVASAASLNQPREIFRDGNGNLFIADALNYRIRKVNTSGIITTVAGSGSFGYSGDGGPATAAQFGAVNDVVFDTAGNMFIADFDFHVIRKVSTAGVISTYVGSGTAGFAGDGGAATAAKLNHPGCLAFDVSGNMFITDQGNDCIRKVTPAGVISTAVGQGGATGFSGDGGQATAARLNAPTGIAFDRHGNLFLSDRLNNRMRKVDTSGIINTFAGSGTLGYSGDGGPATAAEFNLISIISFDNNGNIFVVDEYNHAIRKIDVSGSISTYAGGTFGFGGDGGPASLAQLNHPRGLFIDSNNFFYVSDMFNNRIRMIDTCWLPNIPPIAGGASSICLGDSVALTVASTGGVWSSSNTSAATVSASGFVTTGSYGGTVISYTKSNSCGTVASTKAISVVGMPNPGGIVGLDSLCPGDTTVLTNIAIGGVWSSTDTSRAKVSATGVVTAIAPGSDTIKYTVTNVCGSSTAIFKFKVRNHASCYAGLGNEYARYSNQVVVFPNPNSGTFTMLFTGNEGDEIPVTIYNTLGQKVGKYFVLAGKPKDLNLNIPSGLYYIVAALPGGDRVMEKMVIE